MNNTNVHKTYDASHRASHPFPIDLEQFDIEEREELYWTTSDSEESQMDGVNASLSAGDLYGFRLRLQSVPEGRNE